VNHRKEKAALKIIIKKCKDKWRRCEFSMLIRRSLWENGVYFILKKFY